MVATYTVRSYPKGKEGVLTQAPMWMNFEGIMLNEMSQSLKDKFCMISLYEISKITDS
jgi:hypothetical protein